MKLVVVDVESDGPIPGDYSMIAFAAVIVTPKLDLTFQAKLKPISDKFFPESLAISGFSREETSRFSDPIGVMLEFEKWILENASAKPVFISDNNGYDWMFVCWYFWKFLDRNPFGYSSRRISDLVCGMEKNLYAPWKHRRKTLATHNPLDDAKGNAEVLLDLASNGVKGIL